MFLVNMNERRIIMHFIDAGVAKLTCQVFPEAYSAQLADKVERVKGLLNLPESVALTVAESATSHYRMRAEFRVWHKGDEWFYAMFDVQNKRPVFIEQCPMVHEAIATLMQPLRSQLLANALLSHKLYAIDFMASSDGEVLVTLIYKTPLTDEWQQAAASLSLPEKVMLMGRSRGKKRVLVRDYVEEPLQLASGAGIRLRHVENAFSQPNAGINRQMLDWVDDFWRSQPRASALLELYGGAGNFTWVLAQHADAVVMTELSTQAVEAAQQAFVQAGLRHVSIAAMDSAAVSAALSESSDVGTQLSWQGRVYDFAGILVDPPRAGLDELTRRLTQRFDTIVYISCNPETLARDIATWQDTHELTRAAVFDQFPYTHHVEVGAVLQRK
jgi:tRNA (uracil-5-)-methyltransferase